MKTMAGSRSNPLQSFRVRLATLCLLGVLLLCHGVFGALHLCTTSHAGSSAQHDAYHDHSSQGMGAGSHDHQSCHLMDAGNYYAVLLTTALLGLALGLFWL